MLSVVSCIDGSASAQAVSQAGAWASQRLETPLKLLHVLDKPEQATEGNLSGNIGLGSREELLEQLTSLDEQRGRQALELGKQQLQQAEAWASQAGAQGISQQQRHGHLLETLLELEEDIRLLVLGRFGEAHESNDSLGSNLEKVVRSIHKPILVSVRQFTPPESFMIAYDGSDTANQALSRVASSPLLQGLPCHLVMVGTHSYEQKKLLDQAAQRLNQAGFDTQACLLEGHIEPELSAYRHAYNIDLIVMGAYGHSRIRQFFLGSHTSQMLAKSAVPLLLLR